MSNQDNFNSRRFLLLKKQLTYGKKHKLSITNKLQNVSNA